MAGSYVLKHTTVINKILHGNVKYGCECIVVGYGKGKVAKIYEKRQERDMAYRRQRNAYLAGLAPKPISRFCLEVPIVEIFGEDAGMAFNTIKKRCYAIVSQKANIVNRVPKKELDRLEKQLEKLNIGNHDLHEHNVGIVGNKYVCIDFGNLSTSPIY